MLNRAFCWTVTAFLAILCLGHARTIPLGWRIHHPADPNAYVSLKFELTQSNVERLDEYLLGVADPHSLDYGKFWTPREVANSFRPSQDAIDAVYSWLVNEHDVGRERIEATLAGTTVRLNATIAEAQRILDAKYYVYVHDSSGRKRLGCHGGYYLPPHVSQHIDFVRPTIFLGGEARLQRHASRRSQSQQFTHARREGNTSNTDADSGASGCDDAVTLDCIRGLYEFNYQFVSTDKNTVAVVEFPGESYVQQDIDLFFQTYAPAQVGNHPTLVSIDGGTLAATPGLGEGDLDVELMMGLLDPSQDILLYEPTVINSTLNEHDALLAAFDASYCSVEGVSEQNITDCGDKPIAYVWSISYNFNPDIIREDITPILQRQCTEFGKLALAGVSVIVSSGDSGVGYGGGPGECLTPEGTLSFDPPPNSSFISAFPPSCPYVTSVGATQVTAGNSIYDPETATTTFPSGGGFSNTFPLPSFQRDVVNNYIANFAPPYGPNIYNRSGRASPDLSANGSPIVFAYSSMFGGAPTLQTTFGTSASAPIVASFITAVNDARLAAGKGPVGWINPAIYSPAFRHAFNDITNGTNPGCGTEGFVAAPGWDPVTGLGTPNFPRMLAAFMALP